MKETTDLEKVKKIERDLRIMLTKFRTIGHSVTNLRISLENKEKDKTDYSAGE